MKMREVLSLACTALWRKKGRNFLTMSGVLIGIFSLVLIVSLGQGIRAAIVDTVTSDGNLRQIRLMGGPGVERAQSKKEKISIEGEMAEERRQRLKRAAFNRQRRRIRGDRKINTLNDNVFKELKAQEHIVSIRPLLNEQYKIELGEYENNRSASFGVDVINRRYAQRVMSGNYFSSPTANEVILHEFLLYKWGLVSAEDHQKVIGQQIKVKSINTNSEGQSSLENSPFFRELADDFTEDEKLALEILMPKLLENFGMLRREQKKISETFTVVGVLREFEPGENFSIVEDVNSVQADIYLPQEKAKQLFAAASSKKSRDYSQAVVLVDKAENVNKVEQWLRDNGYTAFSVAGVLDQIDTTLTVLTVMISFLTGIALLVSTLGIVNTMITSVLERTREIGIYKAVGATNKQVMMIFVAESSLIGFTGGLLGLILAGLATIPGDAYALKVISDNTAMVFDGSVFVMPVWLILTGPLLGTLTAVVASLIPARRAAQIDPVAALRYD